jgi:hypothetical protein
MFGRNGARPATEESTGTGMTIQITIADELKEAIEIKIAGAEKHEAR